MGWWSRGGERRTINIADGARTVFERATWVGGKHITGIGSDEQYKVVYRLPSD